MGVSSGAWSTMASEPVTHSTQPTMPKAFNFSLSRRWARTALTRMLSAPSGVTRMAGANAYAAKFAASPTTMLMRPAHHRGSRR